MGYADTLKEEHFPFEWTMRYLGNALDNKQFANDPPTQPDVGRNTERIERGLLRAKNFYRAEQWKTPWEDAAYG